MRHKKESIHAEWINKAKEDEQSIKAILKGEGSPSTACFLAQQMAEKHLKALLLFHKIAFPKTHDLFQLETLLLKTETKIIAIHNELDILNRYYIETRYPGDFVGFSLKEGEEAYEAAQTVKRFVLKAIRGIGVK